ncbi:hypothetical protein [Thioalkalivibrio thiocyanodenitrificans]|uniref:hypothetical protein n=1 Tax=Thioalkalivibrio thiocyanodenitrificans TaxID=243063 RepID=UPI000378DAD8|nr:hypothetical protein [Thioalkalivibrio thiocyanodenitrificans]
MFSLIITMISIALLAALAMVSIYYGGSAYTDRTDQAAAAKIVNDANQISGAALLFKIQEGRTAQGVEELIPRYLTALPQGWNSGQGVLDGYVASNEVVLSDRACEDINARMGYDFPQIPECAQVVENYPGFRGCCTASED